MRIRIGSEMSFDFPQETPLIAMLNVHYSRASDLERPDFLISNPPVPIQSYRDSFGNWCNRFVAPPGRFTFGTDSVIRDPGTFEMGDLMAWQYEVRDLPSDTLLFLLPSRFCESDLLASEAWRLFGHTPLGIARVQAVCDFVHNHIVFSYGNARPTRTAAKPIASKAASAATLPTSPSPSAVRSTSRRATAPATSATSACPNPGRAWISPHGWRSISAVAGMSSIRATIPRASAAS